jgi:hypothetical protein
MRARVNYPEEAKELLQLLQADQQEKREVGRAYFREADKAALQAMEAELKRKTRQRTLRMLQILDEIGEPSIANIGADAAQAVSVLALHDRIDVLQRVLDAFNKIYKRDKTDVYYQAMPSMTDKALLLEHKPQHFGTQWMFSANKRPFLPQVEDFEHVNERRAAYGIEPLRWPKSMAIPESEQPWLKRPLSELIMREPTTEEWKEFEG